MKLITEETRIQPGWTLSIFLDLPLSEGEFLPREIFFQKIESSIERVLPRNYDAHQSRRLIGSSFSAVVYFGRCRRRTLCGPPRSRARGHQTFRSELWGYNILLELYDS